MIANLSRTIWIALGRALFWILWPGLWLVLPWQPRTRVLVRAEGRILATKGWLSTGRWALPGGGLHRGEAPAAGAVRELYEETGLQLMPSQLTPLLTGTYRDAGLRFPCHYFVAELRVPQPLRVQLIELVAVEWIDPPALSPANANPDIITALKAAEPALGGSRPPVVT